MRRVKFRKNTIFAIYLSGLLLACVSAVSWCLWLQSRYHRRQVDDLNSKIVLLEGRLNSSLASSSSPSSSLPSSPIERLRSRESERLFWVEGHGNNRKYAYLDIIFNDGYRARYYFRPFPSRSEVVSLHRRISHDAIVHYYDPGEDI